MPISMKSTEQIRAERGQVTRDGKYTLGRDRFRIRAGDVLPPGAVLDPDPEARSLPAAPETMALPGAAENKARRGKRDTRADRPNKDGDQ